MLLAAIVAAVVVPVGFALSLENESVAMHAAPTVVATTSAGVAAPALIPLGSAAFAQYLAPLPDGARLIAVGTLLLGLAAAVRRSA